ncbi:major capsid protein [Tortoise microvirus 39]|nr:major capsid protein [Tortoise microvirus 39]
MRTSPVPVQRTMRRHDLKVLTSLPAGKFVPLAAVPLLREDAVTRLNGTISFEMSETVEILMNAVNVRVMAYLVPFLAFERFAGMDDLNRSYQKVPMKDGDPVIPFFESMVAPAHGANPILTYMGKHCRPGTNINSAYIEAYNAVWNFRAKNRSPNITQRTRLEATLAPAFWLHSNFNHVVPDFDQAVIDGEVALNSAQVNLALKNADGTPGSAPVSVTGASLTVNSATSSTRAVQMNNTGQLVYAGSPLAAAAGVTGLGGLTADLAAITAELQQDGITISLSNIELARRTQAFAKLRAQYHGHSDEYIIDLLMSGISVPEQAWKQPILLADEHTIFGMSKRYASDAANLTESVVNGGTVIDLSVSVPRVPTGGVVMLFAEITPEQLFERMKDPFLHALDPQDDLPEFVRDTLDPEKVSVVPCEYVDMDHDTPDSTFGYAPLNYEWAQNSPQIGGRFYRPAVDAAFDEDRQRIWAVETQNPTLSEDFYLCTTMHQKPFVVTNVDPFEALLRGEAIISGNTVFGGLLVEANDDYAEVAAKAPVDRIVKPA